MCFSLEPQEFGKGRDFGEKDNRWVRKGRTEGSFSRDQMTVASRNGGVLSRRCRYRRLAAASEVNGRSRLAAVNTVRIPPQPAKRYDYSWDSTSPSLLSSV
jgi:hypothetical protein